MKISRKVQIEIHSSSLNGTVEMRVSSEKEAQREFDKIRRDHPGAKAKAWYIIKHTEKLGNAFTTKSRLF